MHRNLNILDTIFDCCLTAMSKVHFVNSMTSFPFVCDVITHHEEWLGSSTTNLHGGAAVTCLIIGL